MGLKKSAPGTRGKVETHLPEHERIFIVTYRTLNQDFLRSETSFFLVATLTFRQGMASGRVTPAAASNALPESRGSGIVSPAGEPPEAETPERAGF